MSKINKDILGLAGEFAVASELCRRNIYAQLTLGLRKRTDILVETEVGMLRIQRPDFYILTVEDWKKLLEKELIQTGKVARGEVTIDEKNVPIWEDGYHQGWKITPEMIKEHQEKWDKIVAKMVRNEGTKIECETASNSG
jgi:hypothetical protein